MRLSKHAEALGRFVEAAQAEVICPEFQIEADALCICTALGELAEMVFEDRIQLGFQVSRSIGKAVSLCSEIVCQRPDRS